MCFLGGRSLPAPQIPAGQWHPRTPAPSSVCSELSGVWNCPREAVSPLLAGHLSARTSQGSRSPGLSSSLGGGGGGSPGTSASPKGLESQPAEQEDGEMLPWPLGPRSVGGPEARAAPWLGGRALQVTGTASARFRHGSRALPDWRLRPWGASFTLPQPPRCGVTGRVTGSRSEARGAAGLGFCPWAPSPRSASVGSVLTATLRPHSHNHDDVECQRIDCQD